MIRRFEQVKKLLPTRRIPLPLKSICGVFASREGDVGLFTAAEMERAMHTDNQTGRPLPPLDDFVRCVDARVILPGLSGRIIGAL